MIYVYAFLAALVAVTLGTTFANLIVLWVVGIRVKEAEKKQVEAMMAQRAEYIEKFKADMKRRQDYIKMES